MKYVSLYKLTNLNFNLICYCIWSLIANPNKIVTNIKPKILLMLLTINSLDLPGPVEQSVASQTADPGITSLIPAQSHTFVDIDHEIISTVILLFWPFQEGLLSVTSERISAVVEYLSRSQGVMGSSLTSIIVLCPWARHINPCLVLVQPRKTHPGIT